MSEVRPGNSQRGDYPRMLYHADGRTIVVQDPAEHDKYHHEGWDTVPPLNRPRPVSNHGQLGATSDPMIEAIRQVVREEVRAVLREELNLRNIGKRYSNYG